MQPELILPKECYLLAPATDNGAAFPATCCLPLQLMGADADSFHSVGSSAWIVADTLVGLLRYVGTRTWGPL